MKKKSNVHVHIRNSYDMNKYWQPGMPVTDVDLQLLQEVKEVYVRQGYVPTMKEITCAQKLKSRFRTWGNVLYAAGLPSLNDPEQKKKRLEAINLNKNCR